MADCYSGNMSVVLAPGSKMTRMACWAHARRKVYEHHETDPKVSALPLALMNQLYDIERRAMKMSDQDRGELRAKESRKILERLGEYLEGPVAKSILPASKLGGAFNYLRNHWEALNVFVGDGSLPIDNNQVERLMKRVAIGRKNWLFIGSLRAGVRNDAPNPVLAKDRPLGQVLCGRALHASDRLARLVTNRSIYSAT